MMIDKNVDKSSKIPEKDCTRSIRWRTRQPLMKEALLIDDEKDWESGLIIKSNDLPSVRPSVRSFGESPKCN